MKSINTLLLAFTLIWAAIVIAKPTNNSNDNRGQTDIAPLVDAVNDKALVSNMSALFVSMADSMTKMFAGNKALQKQLQDVAHRVQNTTGVNPVSLIVASNGTFTPEKLSQSLPAMTQQASKMLQQFQGPAQSYLDQSRG